MANYLASYLNILVVFGLVFVGYYLSKRGWFDQATISLFSKLVLTLALPFNMFLNITQKFTKTEFLHLFKGMLLPFVSILVTFGIAMLYSKLTKVPLGRQGLFATMFTASNTIFMGLPINVAIFGEKSVPYVLLYYICNTSFTWTIGLYLISRDGQRPMEEKVQLSFKGVLTLIQSPAMLGFLIGLGWLLLEIPSFPIVMRFAKYLGNLTTPLSMFVIGAIIYQTGLKTLKMNKDTFGVLIGRYLISPLIVLALAKFIPVSSMMLKVFVIQSAMPAQNSMPILAMEHRADVEFATTTQAYTFIAYLFVIPVLLYFVN